MNFIYRWLHDRRTSRVEEESTSRSETSTEAGGSPAPRTQVSDGRMVPPSNEVQIPDPWL